MGNPQAKHSASHYFSEILTGSIDRPVNMAAAKAALRAEGNSMSDHDLEELVIREASLAGRAVEL